MTKTRFTADFQSLLHSAAFAARAHHGQLRKDKQTPYYSHVVRVGLIAALVFGISDPTVLSAAVLHDTLEDTTTDYDDLAEIFGADIASWVAALSKDGRKPFDQREEDYCAALAAAPWQVQVCKLADVCDNLLDIGQLPREQRLEAVHKKRRYIDALAAALREEAKEPWQITLGLYNEIEAKVSAAE